MKKFPFLTGSVAFLLAAAFTVVISDSAFAKDKAPEDMSPAELVGWCVKIDSDGSRPNWDEDPCETVRDAVEEGRTEAITATAKKAGPKAHADLLAAQARAKADAEAKADLSDRRWLAATKAIGKIAEDRGVSCEDWTDGTDDADDLKTCLVDIAKKVFEGNVPRLRELAVDNGDVAGMEPLGYGDFLNKWLVAVGGPRLPTAGGSIVITRVAKKATPTPAPAPIAQTSTVVGGSALVASTSVDCTAEFEQVFRSTADCGKAIIAPKGVCAAVFVAMHAGYCGK